jgi:hypothetical protein
MTLPDFLGIGAMRSGTTWLDSILRTHPNIYLPQKRKEVHFFDEHYERGIEWYKEWFSDVQQLSKPIRTGEITPKYLYTEQAPIRIKEHIPDCKFILILRNPVDRAYSHYGFLVRDYAESRSFQECFNQMPEIFLRGLYSQQLQRYLHQFPFENFLVLIYENTIKNPQEALSKIAHFLMIDASQFNLDEMTNKVNSSRSVRFPKARLLATRFRDFLRKQDLDWAWNLAKASGLERAFEGGQSLPKIDQDLRAQLISRYEPDIATLEDILNVDLSLWRKILL